MARRLPGQDSLFDDEDDEFESHSEQQATVRKIVGGGDSKSFLSLISRIADLRLVPCREKIPVEKGWTTSEFWRQHTPIGEAVRKWIALYGQPNFAFALGPYCGRRGDLVIEADNDVGEEWCRANLPKTVAVQARHGRWHRHYAPDAPNEDGVWRGNIIDIFGSKKRHEQKAIEAGFRVRIDPRQKDDEAHLAFVAKERERALAAIPMGPVIDIKCTGGQAMAPGSVHPSGHVYAEVEPWTQEAWDARPTFDAKWFPQEVWAERDRQRMLAASSREGLDDRIDPWWTRERRMRAGLNYARKVGAKSTGENSSATAMRLATVLVRLLALDPPDAREIMQYWGKEICAHEPWSRKELEHKLHDAQQKGRGEFGAWLKDRSQVADARLEAAESQIAEMISGRRQRPTVVQDHITDLDEVELPEDFAAEDAREPDAIIAPAPATPHETPAEVIDLGHARRERAQERGEHGAEPMNNDVIDVFADDPLDEEIDDQAITPRRQQAPAAPAGSEDQLRQVFAQYGIDIKDIRRQNELYHTRTDKEGNIIALDTTTNNIALVFTYSRLYRGMFRLNEMSEEQEFNGISMTDAIDARLKRVVDGMFGKEIDIARVRGGVLLACDADRYNPVKEYIDSLPEWDGVERWKLLAEQVLHVKTDVEHCSVLLEKFGRAAMARALQPGCQAESMLVLQSTKQGIFKTTFGKALFGQQFFSNQPLNINDKDSRMLMNRHWCIEIGEGEILSTPSKVMAFKAFLSQTDDDIRLPYARRIMRMNRRCVFIATTNELRFLHDPTGSRRFWIIEPGDKINIAKLKAWRDQLWAEAKAKFLAHLAAEPHSPEWVATQWWLTDEEQDANDAHNVMRQHEDAWEGDVMEFLMKAGRDPFMVGDVLKHLGVQTGQRDWQNTRRVTEIIRILGCSPYKGGVTVRVKQRIGRFWEPPTKLLGEE